MAASVFGLCLESVFGVAADFRLTGDSTLSQGQVVRALERFSISLEPPVNAATADDAAFYLMLHLQARGFPDAEVTYRLGPEGLVLNISEGRRFVVGQVRFEGGDAIDLERREAIFESVIRQATLTPFGAIGYVERAVEEAVARVAAAYEDEGYIHVNATFTPTFRDRRVDVDVVIEQGQRAMLRSVEVRGTGIPEELVETARADVGTEYFPGAEGLLRSQLLTRLQRLGFYDAEVTQEMTVSESGGVDVVLHVQTGRLYTLRSVRVEGERRTRANAILGRMGLREGKPYDSSEVNAAVRRLWFTGAFEEVEPEVVKVGDGELDLILRVEEGRARQITTTLGYGQWEQAFGVLNYTDRNFLGTLNRFFLTGLVSMRSYGGVVGLSDPALLRTEAAGTVSAYYIRRETPAYRSTFIGAGVGIERVFKEPNATAWRGGYAWRTSRDTTIFAVEGLDGADIDYSLGEVKFGQTLDRRNDPLVPMQGYILRWDGALASRALLGDVSFGKLEVQATGYIPLRKIVAERPFVPFIALNHRVGVIAPYADTRDVPVQERFFLGGPDSVRSFLLDGMAPRDQEGNPSGGLLSLLANAEIQVPIWQMLYGVGFVDAGNLAPTLRAFSWEDTRVAAGVGGRIYTPLGAVRIDYGYNLIRGKGDPIGAWQFGFGFTF